MNGMPCLPVQLCLLPLPLSPPRLQTRRFIFKYPYVLCYHLCQAFTYSFLFLPLHLVSCSYLSLNVTSSRKPSLTSSMLPDILYSPYILRDCLCHSSPLDCKQHECKDHFDISDHPILGTCLDPWHIINAS